MPVCVSDGLTAIVGTLTVNVTFLEEGVPPPTPSSECIIVLSLAQCMTEYAL